MQMEVAAKNCKDSIDCDDFDDLATIAAPPPFDCDAQESRVKELIGDLKTYLQQPEREVDLIGSDSLLEQLLEAGDVAEEKGEPIVCQECDEYVTSLGLVDVGAKLNNGTSSEADGNALNVLENKSPQQARNREPSSAPTNPFFVDAPLNENDNVSKLNPFLTPGVKARVEPPWSDINYNASTDIGLQPSHAKAPEPSVAPTAQTQTDCDLCEPKEQFPRPSLLFPPKRFGHNRPAVVAVKNSVDVACGPDSVVSRRPPPPPIPAVRPSADTSFSDRVTSRTVQTEHQRFSPRQDSVDSRQPSPNFQVKGGKSPPGSREPFPNVKVKTQTSPSVLVALQSESAQPLQKSDKKKDEYPLLLISDDVTRRQTEGTNVLHKSFHDLPEFSSEPYDSLDLVPKDKCRELGASDVIRAYGGNNNCTPCIVVDSSDSDGRRNNNEDKDFRFLKTITEEEITRHDSNVQRVTFQQKGHPSYGEILVGVPTATEEWEHGGASLGRASVYSVTSNYSGGDRSVNDAAFLDESMMRPDVTDVESLQGEGGEVESRLRINHFLVPVLTLEVLILTCLAILAFYLRFTDEFPVFERAIFCDDKSLRHSFFRSGYATFEVHPTVLYSVSFLLPPILIVVGEVGYWLFSTKPRKVVRAHCTTCKITLTYRRLLRFIGAFLLGALCTSILTDAIKLMAGRPRPYFLDVCDPHSTLCSPNSPIAVINGTSACAFGNAHDVRHARLSFPSFYAALSSYSAIYTMIYLHNILRMHGTYALRPLLVLLIGGLSLLAGFSRLMAYHNHWEDVLAGFILGSGIAAYFGILLMNKFQEHSPKRRPEMYMSPPEEGSKFFRWFWIPRITFGKNSQRGYGGMYSNGPNDKGPLGPNPAFQQDLHRRIENFGKKNQKQVKHPKQPPPQPPLPSQSPKAQTPEDGDDEVTEHPEITTMQTEDRDRNSD